MQNGKQGCSRVIAGYLHCSFRCRIQKHSVLIETITLTYRYTCPLKFDNFRNIDSSLIKFLSFLRNLRWNFLFTYKFEAHRRPCRTTTRNFPKSCNQYPGINCHNSRSRDTHRLCEGWSPCGPARLYALSIVRSWLTRQILHLRSSLHARDNFPFRALFFATGLAKFHSLVPCTRSYHLLLLSDARRASTGEKKSKKDRVHRIRVPLAGITEVFTRHWSVISLRNRFGQCCRVMITLLAR